MELSKLLTIQNGRFVNRVCAAELEAVAEGRRWISSAPTEAEHEYRRAWLPDIIEGGKRTLKRAKMARIEATNRRIGVHGI